MKQPSGGVGQMLHFLNRLTKGMSEAVLFVDQSGKVVSANAAAARLFDMPYRDGALPSFAVYNQILKDSIVGGHHCPPLLLEGLRRSLRGETVSRQQVTITTVKGAQRVIAFTTTPIGDELGDVLLAALIARDVTEQQRTAAYWRVVGTAAQGIARELDVDRVLNTVLDQVVKALGAQVVIGIWYLDKTSGILRLRTYRGLRESVVAKVRHLPMDCPSVLCEVAQTGQVKHFGDVRAQPLACDLDQYLVEQEDMGSLVIAPLISREDILGVLVYGFRGASRFYNQDMKAVRTVSELFAAAIDHAELYQASQRKEAESEAIIEGIGDGLIVYDKQGRVVRANKSAEQMLGLGFEQLGAMTLDEWLQSQSVETPQGKRLPVEKTPVMRALRGEEVEGFHMIVHRPDGEKRHVLESAGPIVSQGAVVGVVASFHDINDMVKLQTERERLLARIQSANERMVGGAIRERELAEEAERRQAELDTIIEYMPNGVISYSAEGRVTRVNKAGAAILGVERETLIDQLPPGVATILEVETPDGRPVTPEMTPSSRALAGEAVAGFEVALRQPGGRTVRIMVNSAPIRDAQGRIVAAVCTFNDITRIMELQQTQKEITSIVAHDIRQPLTTILGQAQLAERSLNQIKVEPARKSVEAIITGARRMNAMVEDLVDSVRLESGRLYLRRIPLDLGDYLRDLLQRSEVSLDVQRVRLLVEKGMPSVSVDPDKLERVALNLLSNALKYSDPGTPVDVLVSKKNDQALVAVRDRGQGIVPEDVPHLFERFYRTKGPQKKESIGLGLYITRKLVEAHGGSIWVESKVGQGSTFYFSLPLA